VVGTAGSQTSRGVPGRCKCPRLYMTQNAVITGSGAADGKGAKWVTARSQLMHYPCAAIPSPRT
jgi:hypothetical protein